MFRRRGLMRPMRRAFTPDIPPLLLRANQFMQNGDHAAAAEAFEQLARAALARRGPRAPIFFLQAGRARLLNHQAAMGVEYFKQGLSLLAASGLWARFSQAGDRAVQELEQLGLAGEAAQIQKIISDQKPAGGAFQSGKDQRTKKVILPTHCPSCGAAVRPDEIEWLDEVTAECGYCGSPVRAETT